MALLPEHIDPLGHAIKDYHETARNAKILVMSDIAEDERISSSYFFRNYNAMPVLEKTALENCQGRILDIGAAAGCHSLILQGKGFDVTAMDISQLSCKVMAERGIYRIVCNDFFQYSDQKFDTLLLLMNGIGIAGNLKKLDSFFKHAENMLNPGGRIIFDSTDVDYMYSEPDGSKLINLNSNYYGELTYTMQYRKITGNPFEWLYVDYDTMASIAVKNGFDHVRLATGKHYNYLVMLVKKS